MLTSNLDTSDFTLVGLFRNVSYFPSSFSFDATKTVLTINYSNLPEDNYTLTLLSADGRFEDQAGNNLDGEPVWPLPPGGSGDGVEGGNFLVHFSLDAATTAFPGSLTSLSPAGGLIYTRTTTGVMNSADDSDAFSLTLDATQTLTIAAGGGGSSSPLKPVVEILNASGTVLAGATAPAAGKEALLQTLPLPGAGTYTVRVSNAASAPSAGTFNLQVWENAAVETEAHGGPTDDTRATAQNLDAAFIPLDPTGALTRAGAVGTLPAGTSANDDWYSFSANANEPLSLAVAHQSGAGETLALFDAAGNLLASGAAGATNSTASITNFVAPTADTYYARVSGGNSTAYQLVVVRGAAFEFEPNDTLAAAQGSTRPARCWGPTSSMTTTTASPPPPTARSRCGRSRRATGRATSRTRSTRALTCTTRTVRCWQPTTTVRPTGETPN
jgi:hypothetical protein